MRNNLPLLLLWVVIFVAHPVDTFSMTPLFSERIQCHARHGFIFRNGMGAPLRSPQPQSLSQIQAGKAGGSNDGDASSSGESNYDFEDGDDESLLKVVQRDQLEGLCDQLNLSQKGSKAELLARLRAYSLEKSLSDKERNRQRAGRIQRGVDNEGDGKARHIILEESNGQDGNDDDSDEDLEGFFYFSLPDGKQDAEDLAKINSAVSKVSIDASQVGTSQSYVTAPPPPPNAKTNADGERTVTIYSSTDQNDLTGAEAARSSVTGNTDAATLGSSPYSPTGGAAAQNPQATLAGGPFGDQSGSIKRKASEKEMDKAVDIITELVLNLLAMTGAPGFQDDIMSMEKENTSDKADNVFATAANLGYVGFEPSRVPTSLLTDNSNVLRIANGEALRKVLTDLEMRAIGLDGRAGDNKDKGGGHYLEVRKVATFLEGFRKAEVRKVARETATMLLDKLVADGVKGLDEMLMAMTRGSDDSSDAGELNDSLVFYLEDAIRQQEKKVGKKIGIQGIKSSWTEMSTDRSYDGADNELSDIWNTTTGEDGVIVESLDPNDPIVKQTLERELDSTSKRKPAPISPLEPAEQLLILLTLLKERVKAEAVFSNDEKGRNLRVLAYCLHANNEKDRETIVMDNFGSSLDRLDSFSELLTSSIDYAESTSHQLQPSKSAPLDIRLLKSIKRTVEDMKESQAWKASGISAQEQNRMPL